MRISETYIYDFNIPIHIEKQIKQHDYVFSSFSYFIFY